MTRIVYISDTHVGEAVTAYHQQAKFSSRAGEIVGALGAWLGENGGADLVLHGGDLIDVTRDELIVEGEELMAGLGVPVRLCVGNHDLTVADSEARWLRLAPALFEGGELTFSVSLADCEVHVVPNQWGPERFLWEGPQDVSLLEEQMVWLEEAVQRRPEVVHVVNTHSPTGGLPTAQTGFAEDYHPGGAAFGAWFKWLVRKYPQVRLVLSAHSHLNMHWMDGGAHFVSSSALVEVPFEFKVIEIDGGRIEMKTVSLHDRVGFEAVYDFDKTYVQGRPCDRGFVDEPDGEPQI